MKIKEEAKAFSKAQLSAFIGGILDFATMIFCVEVIGWHYSIGIAIGGIAGALVNYLINKYWTFKGVTEKTISQVGKFILVVFGSIVLKNLGTLFFTEVINVDYRLSRLITDAIVAFGYNYTLQRLWVFGKQMKDRMS